MTCGRQPAQRPAPRGRRERLAAASLKEIDRDPARGHARSAPRPVRRPRYLLDAGPLTALLSLPVAALLAQTWHQANEHRAHVGTILGGLGHEPLDDSA